MSNTTPTLPDGPIAPDLPPTLPTHDAEAPFRVVADFTPSGDQPTAIEGIVEAFEAGEKAVTLLGATGTGKTFTAAKALERLQRPALVIAPNKTLAAQLANEFRDFLPDNAVEYFVSYYDYYQPEAYVPSSDTYIEKDSSINDEIDRLRHRATMALLSRRDVVVVASVSCIYGLGSPHEYEDHILWFKAGEEMGLDRSMRKLVDLQYTRNDLNLVRGTFRVRGDTLEVFPADADKAIRVEFFGDEVDRISRVDTLTGEVGGSLKDYGIFPASHYVTSDETTVQRPPHDRDRARRAARAPREGGQAARGPAPADAYQLRPRDDPRGRVLQRHRELLAALRRPRPGRTPLHVARLLPEGLRPVRGRVARHRAPDRRHVRG